MTDKPTYRPDELAVALEIKVRKVLDMLRRGEIDHVHICHNHTNVRIPRKEYLRLVGEKRV